MATRTWVGTNDLFEAVDSGRVERAEKTTLTKVYWGDYPDCLDGSLPKGTVGGGLYTGYVVRQSTVDRLRGDVGRLTIIWEAGGPDGDVDLLPPDRANLQSQDLNPSAEKNPGFADAINDQTLYKEDATTGTGGKTLLSWVRIAGLTADANESDKAWKLLKQLLAVQLTNERDQ